MSAVLGLDIGTSYFSGAFWWRNDCYFIENDGPPKLSVVKDRSRTQQSMRDLVKQATSHRINENYLYVIACDNYYETVLKFQHPDETLTPGDNQSSSIRYLKRLAEERLGQRVNRAVVAVPAYFDGNQRQAIVDACTKAGIRVLQLINEPTAAILSFYTFPCKIIEPGFNVIVFDMGSSSTKFTMVTIEGAAVKIREVLKFNCISGDHFDRGIVNYVVGYIRTRCNANFNPSTAQVASVKKMAEESKILLSSMNTSTIVMNVNDGRNYKVLLTQEILEELCTDLIGVLKACLNEVYRVTSVTNFKIHRVLMMGGAYNMPVIRNTIVKFFGQELVLEACHRVVAGGAAILAGMLTGDIPGHVHDIQGMKFLPNSLGINNGENTLVFIEKGAELPRRDLFLLQITCQQQMTVTVYVLEGEQLVAYENRCLGSMLSTVVTPGQPATVEVALEIDRYCILKMRLRNYFGQVRYVKFYANAPKQHSSMPPILQTHTSNRVSVCLKRFR